MVRSALVLALAAASAQSIAARPAGWVAAAAPGAGNVDDFYRARGGAPLWFSPTSGNAAQQMLQLLASAGADGLNPNRYRVRSLARAVQAASTGNPEAVRRADVMLSQALVAYASDLRRNPRASIIYVDPELRNAPPSATALLSQAARAPSLADYVGEMGWMSPIYADLRKAIASRSFRSEQERRLLSINLERARAIPSDYGRYVIVNPVAQRLYMYENGKLVDQMRVIAGKPDPIAQTPMMHAFIRFVVLNPYWNAPADIAAKRLAPNVLKGGRSYLKAKGYDILSDWSDNAKVIDPMSVDWKAVVAGRTHVRMRQKPGPANSMGKMKFMFPNKQGIWLHDTPEKEKLDEAARLASNGCVRLQDAPRFARWLFGGPLKSQGSKPEQEVALPSPVPIYITYLTAVPSGSSVVYFDDVYGLDARAGQIRRG